MHDIFEAFFSRAMAVLIVGMVPAYALMKLSETKLVQQSRWKKPIDLLALTVGLLVMGPFFLGLLLAFFVEVVPAAGKIALGFVPVATSNIAETLDALCTVKGLLVVLIFVLVFVVTPAITADRRAP